MNKRYQTIIIIAIFLIGLVVKVESIIPAEEECNRLLQQADEYFNKQPQKALEYYLEATQIINLPDENRVKVLEELSRVYLKLKQFDNAHKFNLESEKLYSKKNDFDNIANTRDFRARILIDQENYEQADSLITQNIIYRERHKLSLVNTKEIRGYYYHTQDKPALEITYYLAILDEVRESKDIENLAYLLQLMGDAYRNSSDLKSSYSCYRESYGIYKQLGNQLKIGRLLFALGTITKQQGNYDVSLDYLLQALKFSVVYDKPSRISSNLRNIGNIYKKLGDIPEALKFYKRALEYVENSDSHLVIATIFTNIGNTYNSIGDSEEALKYYNKALPHIIKTGDKRNLASHFHNMGYYYRSKNKYAEAEEAYLKSIAYSREIGYKRGVVLTLVNLGGLYLGTDDIVKAETSLQEALKISKKIGLMDKTKDIYEGFFEFYSKNGDYKKAFENSILYSTIKDSILSSQKTVAIAHIQEKYETEKRSNEIKTLEQVNGEQELKLAKSRLTFWRLLFVLLIIAIILPFLIRRYFDKSKKAKNLEKLVSTQEKSLQETISNLRNTTLKKDQAEMKQVIFQENFDFLYKTAIEFLRLSSEDDIYQYLAKSIHEMAGDSIIFVSSYHKESNILTNRAVHGLDLIGDRFVKILGQNPIGLKLEVPQYAREILKRGKLTFIKGGFHEFTFYTVPHHISDAIVRLCGITEIYTIGFYFNDELWGNASIMLTNGNTLANVSGLEAFINQAAMAIQKRHVQIELQDSEEKYRQLVEQINDAIIVVQGEEIKFFNKRFTQLLGIEAKGSSSIEFNALLPQEIKTDLQKILEEIMNSKEEYIQLDTNLTDAAGRDIAVDIRSSFIIYDRYQARLLVIRDVTDLKVAQKRLLYSERLSGLGELAAGVAHEIKNPLGNISSSAQIISSDYKISEDAKLYLDIIQRNVENANKTVKKLTDFATPGEINMRPASIIEVIDSTCMLLKGKLRENNISLEKDFQQIPDLIIDPVHIQGVMVNIVINAIQAQKTGGLLRITVDKTEDEVSIIFKDDGCGISERNQKRVFNPFFTTKEEGSGLGLSMAYKVMHHHHGKIDIFSEVDQGTTVILHFPLKF